MQWKNRRRRPRQSKFQNTANRTIIPIAHFLHITVQLTMTSLSSNHDSKLNPRTQTWAQKTFKYYRNNIRRSEEKPGVVSSRTTRPASRRSDRPTGCSRGESFRARRGTARESARRSSRRSFRRRSRRRGAPNDTRSRPTAPVGPPDWSSGSRRRRRHRRRGRSWPRLRQAVLS